MAHEAVSTLVVHHMDRRQALTNALASTYAASAVLRRCGDEVGAEERWADAERIGLELDLLDRIERLDAHDDWHALHDGRHG